MAIESLSNPTPTYYANSIAAGFVYECSCGEMFSNADSAYHCRKCRNYCVFGRCTHVIDVRNGEVVRGEEPSAEEHAEAAAEAEKRWAAEHAEWQQWQDEQDAEYEHWLLEQSAKQAEEAKRAAEAEEDALWDIQDQWEDR